MLLFGHQSFLDCKLTRSLSYRHPLVLSYYPHLLFNAQVEFHASKPIVPFRETAVRFPQSVAQAEASGKGSTTEGSGPTATQRQFQVSQFGFSGSGGGPMGK